jgi:hypothetical protein
MSRLNRNFRVSLICIGMSFFLLPTSRADNDVACEESLKSYFKQENPEILSRFLRLQAKLTTHRLAWLHLKRLQSKSVTVVKSKLEDTIRELLTEKEKQSEGTPEFEKLSQKLYSFPHTRSTLASVIQPIAEISRNLSFTDEELPFRLDLEDIHLVQLLGTVEEKSGNFSGAFTRKPSSAFSVLNLMKIIDSSYRRTDLGSVADQLKRVEEVLSQGVEEMKRFEEEVLPKLISGKPECQTLFSKTPEVLNCGADQALYQPGARFGAVLQSLGLDTIQGLLEEKKFSGLTYGEVWLGVRLDRKSKGVTPKSEKEAPLEVTPSSDESPHSELNHTDKKEPEGKKPPAGDVKKEKPSISRETQSHSKDKNPEANRKEPKDNSKDSPKPSGKGNVDTLKPMNASRAESLRVLTEGLSLERRDPKNFVTYDDEFLADWAQAHADGDANFVHRNSAGKVSLNLTNSGKEVPGGMIEIQSRIPNFSWEGKYAGSGKPIPFQQLKLQVLTAFQEKENKSYIYAGHLYDARVFPPKERDPNEVISFYLTRKMMKAVPQAVTPYLLSRANSLLNGVPYFKVGSETFDTETGFKKDGPNDPHAGEVPLEMQIESVAAARKSSTRGSGNPDRRAILSAYEAGLSDGASPTCKRFGILDKKTGNLEVYERAGKQVRKLETIPSLLGAKSGDGQAHWKDYGTSHLTEEGTTPAGTFIISEYPASRKIDPDFQGNALLLHSLVDQNHCSASGLDWKGRPCERLTEMNTFAIHQVPRSLQGRYAYFNQNPRVSNTCINLREKAGAKDFTRVKTLLTGCPLHVLPEEPGNRFQIENGRLAFTVSAEKKDNRDYFPTPLNAGPKTSLKAGISPFVFFDTGANRTHAGHLADNSQSLNYLRKFCVGAYDSFFPLGIPEDVARAAKKEFCHDFEAKARQNARKFSEAIVNEDVRSKMMKAYNLSDIEYGQIAKAAFGIYGVESRFGVDPKLIAKSVPGVQDIGQAVRAVFRSPEKLKSAGLVGAIAPVEVFTWLFGEGVMNGLEAENSKGGTQIKFDSNFKKDRSEQKVQSVLRSGKAVSISGDRLSDPFVSAVATMEIMAKAHLVLREEAKNPNRKLATLRTENLDQYYYYFYNGGRKAVMNGTATPALSVRQQWVNDFSSFLKLTSSVGAAPELGFK